MAKTRKQVVQFTPPQAKRLVESTRWFEAQGRNHTENLLDPPPRYRDWWIEITGAALVSGVYLHSWKRKQRIANNLGEWQDHLVSAVSTDGTGGNPDTRAAAPGGGLVPTGSIVRAIVDVGADAIITYTIENGGLPGSAVAYLTQVGGLNGDDGTTTTAAFPTYTYNAYFDAAKTKLAGGTLTVQAHRDLKIAVTPASLGIIQKNSSNTYSLMAVLDEYRDRDTCP